MDNKHYGRLVLMAMLSFIAMYVLMYAVVNELANVYPNLNQFYMAGLMAAPMVMIEIAPMSAMYHNKRLNLGIAVASVIALLAFWFGIRQQTAIDDEQFLKSMIPHHAGAILMCEKANLTDNGIAVQEHHRKPTGRDRSDEGQARWGQTLILKGGGRSIA